MDFSEHLTALLARDRTAPAIQYEGGWFTWGEAADIAAGIDAALTEAGLSAGATVGLVMRNRPGTVAGFYALLATQRAALLFSGRLPDAALQGEITSLRPAALIADAEDWHRPGLIEAAAAAGIMGIEITGNAQAPVRVIGQQQCPGPKENAGAQPHHRLPTDTAVTLLTSGTTGPAKRIPVYYAELNRRLAKGRASSGVAINALPLYNMGGVFGLVDAVVRSRPVAIMEHFDVWRWAELVRQHRPKQTGSPPAVLRMLLDQNIPRETFAGVQFHYCASSALDPQLARAFSERYGIPVVQGWGATEMKGSVTNWTEDERNTFLPAKQGSCGRAVPGVKVRIVHPDTDTGTAAPCPAGIDGRVEVWRADFPGEDHWMSTNDLGHLDEDGFLWIKGRLDDVIVRGGLKIEPREVEEVLNAHPDVAEAVVLGLSDERLGEVPVAAVVAIKGRALDEAALLALLRGRLASYKVPVRVVVVEAIPRNAMMKVERGTLRQTVEARLRPA